MPGPVPLDTDLFAFPVIDPGLIRSAREAAGYRKEAVAELLGLSWSAITAYERGQSMPSSRVLVALAHIYRVPVEDFCRPGPVGAL